MDGALHKGINTETCDTLIVTNNQAYYSTVVEMVVEMKENKLILKQSMLLALIGGRLTPKSQLAFVLSKKVEFSYLNYKIKITPKIWS